jgi:hypothetical protein
MVRGQFYNSHQGEIFQEMIEENGLSKRQLKKPIFTHRGYWGIVK